MEFRADGPVLEAFLHSQSFVQIIRGPLGSGKTTTAAFKVFELICNQRASKEGIRKSRVAIVRNTYPDLTNTTIRDWRSIVPENCGKFTMGHPPEHVLDFDLPDGTKVYAEVIFVALDKPEDVRKLRGMQLTFAWINEMKEVPIAVIAMLTGRIDRYPKQGYSPWVGILGDSNAWDEDHELQKWAELAERKEMPGYEFFTQPGGVIKVDGKWVVNPNRENQEWIGPEYYERQIPGKTQDWIKVNLANEIGFSFDGKPVHPDYSDVFHKSETLLVPRSGVVRVGMDFGLCYSDDTEVLTESGWKLFKDVDERTERVATLNPDGFGLEYTPVNFKVEYDYDGELVHFKSQNFDFLVTPEHRTPYTNRETPHQLRFASAEELSRQTTAHKFIQLQTASWSGKSFDFFGLPEDLAAEFLGWYLSEGSTEKKGNHFRASIAQKKPAPALDALLARPEWGLIRWRRNPNGWRAAVPPAMGAQLLGLGKAWTKHVPRFVKNASSDVIRAFLDSYTRGDGHVRTKAKENSGVGRKVRDEICIATVSAQMANDLQELALKAGYCSAIRRQKGQTSRMPDGREIVSSGVFIVAIKRFARAEIKAEHVRRVPYKGKIYCLNVPHHTLYVRRNGRPCWNGNTPAALFEQRQENGQWWIFDEIVTEDAAADEFALEVKARVSEWDAQVPGLSWVFRGDPAGDDRMQTDKQTCFQVLRINGIPANPASTNDVEIRRAALDRPLTRVVAGGLPGLLVSPNCVNFRKGMAGGFCYKRVSIGGEERYRDVPDKNKYSHIVEAGEYGLLDGGEHAIRNPATPKANLAAMMPQAAMRPQSWDPMNV